MPRLLFFLSGALALIYELLWMRELSLLFGATAHAASVTLAAFFAGLALGGWFWGRRAAGFHRPLLAYGVMELGIALAAGGCLSIIPLFRRFYPVLFAAWGDRPDLFLTAKFILSLAALFPAAFLIGGTLPVISRVRARHRTSAAQLFYALNTLGAAGGALLAGFWLPERLGFRGTYWFAMAMSAMIGLIACLAGRASPAVAASSGEARMQAGWRSIDAYAFLSGFAVIALEVLWTRMFAQVLQNSVHTFSLILAACVLGLALGAFMAHRLAGSGWNRQACLYFLLIGASILTALSPHVFMAATDGLRYAGQGLGWDDYLLHVAGLVLLAIGPALVAAGTVFPLLFSLAGRAGGPEGGALGRLLLANLLGSVCGAVAAGFFLLEWLGLWDCIRLVAMLYLLAVLAGVHFRQFAPPWQRALPLAAVVLLVSALDTSRLPIVRIDPLLEQEILLQAWEDDAGVVAVVRHGDHLKIKQDNHYTLGGSGSAGAEALQGSLPVLLHPRAEAVFALGLGTGITAGAALRHPIRRLEVAELLPNAIEAARLYFASYHFGLFDDPRSRVLQEDGRNYLAATRRRYDLIVGDLFVPWQAGAGSLYALEHFRAAREHLRDDGLFMQWLPAYQISRDEFGSIVRTLLTAFPQVTLWRGDFSPRTPVLGLLAQPQPAPLSSRARLLSGEPDAVAQGGARLLMHYVGRLDPDQFEGFPVNSDDRPVIEQRAPVTQRRQKLGEAQWLTGPNLIELLTEVRRRSGEMQDSYLAQVPAPMRRLPEAGLCRHRAEVEKQEGYLMAAEQDFVCVDEILRQVGDVP